MSFLLGTHPDISTIGERRKFYNKSIRPNLNETQDCSCGKTFQDCEFWSDIRDRLFSRISPSDLKTNVSEFRFYNNKYLNQIASESYKFSLLNGFPKLLQPFSGKAEKLCRFNQILTEEILKPETNSAFLDSSKIIDHALFLSQIKDFDFYVIWLSRDPRAQVNSALKYNDWSIEQATRRWKKEMKENARILRKTGINHTVLRYEELCKKPEKEMRRILSFVGMNADGFNLDFREQKQHIMGNRNMRLGTDTKIIERKDWQEKLSADDIKTIEKMTAGYRNYYSI